MLVLSEFAGAAAQLQSGALLVNPYDIEGGSPTHPSSVSNVVVRTARTHAAPAPLDPPAGDFLVGGFIPARREITAFPF